MRSLWLLVIAHAVNHAYAVLLPLIYLKIIDEFRVSEGQIAYLAAFGAVVSGLVQLSFASLTRVFSRRVLLGAGGLLFGGGFAAQALAGGFGTFAIPNVLSRIGAAPQHPVGNGLLAEQFPPQRRGFAISAHIAGRQRRDRHRRDHRRADDPRLRLADHVGPVRHPGRSSSPSRC